MEMIRHRFDPKRAIMIGDNLSTDIQFGLNSGVRTLLVMGGKRDPDFSVGNYSISKYRCHQT